MDARNNTLENARGEETGKNVCPTLEARMGARFEAVAGFGITLDRVHIEIEVARVAGNLEDPFSALRQSRGLLAERAREAQHIYWQLFFERVKLDSAAWRAALISVGRSPVVEPPDAEYNVLAGSLLRANARATAVADAEALPPPQMAKRLRVYTSALFKQCRAGVLSEPPTTELSLAWRACLGWIDTLGRACQRMAKKYEENERREKNTGGVK